MSALVTVIGALAGLSVTSQHPMCACGQYPLGQVHSSYSMCNPTCSFCHKSESELRAAQAAALAAGEDVDDSLICVVDYHCDIDHCRQAYYACNACADANGGDVERYFCPAEHVRQSEPAESLLGDDESDADDEMDSDE